MIMEITVKIKKKNIINGAFLLEPQQISHNFVRLKCSAFQGYFIIS